jgi:hypothetical protein
MFDASLTHNDVGKESRLTVFWGGGLFVASTPYFVRPLACSDELPAIFTKNLFYLLLVAIHAPANATL